MSATKVKLKLNKIFIIIIKSHLKQFKLSREKN